MAVRDADTVRHSIERIARCLVFGSNSNFIFRRQFVQLKTEFSIFSRRVCLQKMDLIDAGPEVIDIADEVTIVFS